MHPRIRSIVQQAAMDAPIGGDEFVECVVKLTIKECACLFLDGPGRMSLTDLEKAFGIDSETEIIRKQILEIKAKEQALRKEYLALQSKCPHLNSTVTKESLSDFGDFRHTYKYDYYCPDCDKRWSNVR